MCVLSMLLTGLGQIIMGQSAKGFCMMLAAIFLGIPLIILTFGVAIPLIWAVSAVDAYKIATKLKQGSPVGAWEFF